MLFTKRKKFEILNGQIKEELNALDGNAVLKINLKYPKIQCSKGDKAELYAKTLYEKIALGLAEYAKTELYKKALSVYSAQPQSFKPFSAVLNWENTYMDENYLSILLEISIGDSMGSISSQKKTQVWDRKSGTKCDITDFLSADKVKEIKKSCAKDEEGAFFHKELFLLREKSIEFLLIKNGGYIPLKIARSQCFA